MIKIKGSQTSLSKLVKNLSSSQVKELVQILRKLDNSRNSMRSSQNQRTSQSNNKKSNRPKSRKKPPAERKNSLRNVLGEIKLKQTIKIAEIIHPFFKECVELSQIKSDLDATVGVFNHMIRERGIREGTKRYKIERQYAIREQLGLPNQVVPVLKLDRDGWPAKYRYLKDRIDSPSFSNRAKTVKYLNTILSLSRIVSDADKNINSFPSITTPIKKSDELIHEIAEFKSDLPQIFKDLGIDSNDDPRTLKVKESPLKGGLLSTNHSTNTGPNNNVLIKGRRYRGNATVTSHVDALAVINDSEVCKNMKRFAALSDNESLMDLVKDLSQLPQSRDWNPKPCCSRIGILNQPENKLRVVAIIDYWSQTLLKPLHKKLQKVALKVPCSYYEDQDAGRELCREFTRDQKADPVSYDATDFTDRFPRLIQEAVLSVLFNEEFARSAIRLMACRNFKTPGGKFIRYATGQPMGSYGSFALAHLTHALYAYWKVSLFGGNPKLDVAVVGDDIAFRNNSKYVSQYLLGMEVLGVPFNRYKGFESSDQKRIVEFCKRLYVNGDDQSALSLRVAKLAATDFKYLPTLDQYIDTDVQVYDLLRVPSLEKYRAHLEKLYILPSEITGIKNNLKPDSSMELDESTYEFINKLKDIEEIGRISINEFLGTLYAKALIAYAKVMHMSLLETTGVLALDPTGNPAPGAVGKENLANVVLSKAKNKLASMITDLPENHPIKVTSRESVFDIAKANLKIRLRRQLHDLPSIVQARFDDPLSSGKVYSDLISNKKFVRTTVGDPKSVLSDEGKETWVQALFAISNAMIDAIMSTVVSDKHVETKMFILPKKNNIEVELKMDSPVPELEESPARPQGIASLFRNLKNVTSD